MADGDGEACAPYVLGDVVHGEALGLLQRMPDACVDMVLTDEPYSSGGFTRGDRMDDPRTKYCQNAEDLRRHSFTGDNRDQRAWAYWCALWLHQAKRVTKPGGYIAIFSDWRQLPTATDAIQAGGWVWRGVVAWDKGEGARAPHTGYFRHQAEYVAWGTNGPLGPCKHGGPFPGVIRCTVRNKHHLVGKPTELMRELVKPCPPGGIVLDPFAGSGTTIIAAELEGRRALGFEIDASYVQVSRDRIAASRAGIDYVSARAGQVGLFA